MLVSDVRSIHFAREAKAAGIERVVLLAGGPPCQGFSTVGSKKFHDPRNSLFHEYLRAVKELEPDYVLFENVSGFKNLYEGIIYNLLLSELDSLGYKTASGVLEAADFGLPQFRQRTIVIGWRSRLIPVCLPQPTHGVSGDLFGLRPRLTLIDAISDLPAIGVSESASHYHCDPANDYQRVLRRHTTELTEHNAACYGDKMQEILRLVPPGGSVEDLPERLRPKSYFKNTYARLLPDVPSPTITRNFGTPSSSRCIHPYQNRALSTREGARLQGFPDSYLFTGSKTSKNLQIGNAVPPIFGEVIANAILSSSGARSSERVAA